LESLPERTDQELVRLSELATQPLPELPTLNLGAFCERLSAMRSVLINRKTDDVSGELVLEIYWAILGSFPAEALDFMVLHACASLKFFPVPAECLEILSLWRRDDDLARHQTALRSALIREQCRRLPVRELLQVEPWEPAPGEAEKLKARAVRLAAAGMPHSEFTELLRKEAIERQSDGARCAG
jgi:hypothetical protein